MSKYIKTSTYSFHLYLYMEDVIEVE